MILTKLDIRNYFDELEKIDKKIIFKSYSGTIYIILNKLFDTENINKILSKCEYVSMVTIELLFICLNKKDIIEKYCNDFIHDSFEISNLIITEFNFLFINNKYEMFLDTEKLIRKIFSDNYDNICYTLKNVLLEKDIIINPFIYKFNINTLSDIVLSLFTEEDKNELLEIIMTKSLKESKNNG